MKEKIIKDFLRFYCLRQEMCNDCFIRKEKRKNALHQLCPDAYDTIVKNNHMLRNVIKGVLKDLGLPYYLDENATKEDMLTQEVK